MLRKVSMCLYALALAALAPRAAADERFGPIGPEFDVSLSSGSVSVARGAGGRFLTTWTTGGQVWARLFDDPGIARGAAFLVGDASPNLAYFAQATAGVERFVVLFAVASPGARLGYAVYDSGGVLVRHGDVVSGDTFGATLAVSRTGDFMVVWSSVSNPRAGGSLMARVFDGDGVPRGDTVTLVASGQAPHRPAVAADRSNGYLVAWTDAVSLVSAVRRFDAQGAPAEALSTLGGPAKLCTRASGSFVAAWQDTSSAPYPPYPLWIRSHGADGAPLGPARQIDVDAPAIGNGLALGCSADGASLVTWASELGPDTTEVYARRYDGGGVADGPAFRVNDLTAGIQLDSAVGVDAMGDFTIAWWDSVTPADTRLRGRVYSLAPRPAKGDFDRDGHPDLVLRRVSDGQARVWTMRESARVANLAIWPQTPDWAWHLGAVDDFDADGDADLLLRHQSTGAIDVWLLGGASGVERVGQTTITGAVLPPPEWIVAASADFDGDRRPDLLWRNLVTNKLAVWLLDGTVWRATRMPTPDQAVDANWKVVAAGDFDGDGHSDVLFYNVVSGRVVQWLLDATLTRRTGRFTNPAGAGDANWNVVAAADYGFGLRGQAGTPDLVWRNDTTGKLVVWYLDGAGVRTSGVFTAPDAPSDPLGFTVAGPR